MVGRHCNVCRDEYDEDIGFHNNTEVHRFNFLLYEWNYYKKALVKNRHGVDIQITPQQLNGYIINYSYEPKKGNHVLKVSPNELIRHNNEFEFRCLIKNIRNSDSVILTSAVLLHPYELYSLHDPLNNIGINFVELRAGANYSISVRFNIQNVVIGSYKMPVCFNFQTVNELAETFSIARCLVVCIEETVQEDEPNAKSPFTNKDWPHNVIIHPPTQKMKHICMYPIPARLLAFLKSGLREFNGITTAQHAQLMDIRNQVQPGHVTSRNYVMFWHIMLWMEELVHQLMLTRYNMEEVHMTLISGNKLELEVPGLAEKRPSVIKGDMVDIRIHNDHTAYQGMISKVNDKTVHIDYVDDEFTSYIKNNPKVELDVRFVLGRLPFERMHNAVDLVASKGLIPCLFPEPNVAKMQPPRSRTIQDSEFVNRDILGNPEQKLAVLNIVNGSSMSVPYIVFGPPGTGKTVTIVEAILQIKKNTSKKILVCAPANAACNMLTEKLMKYCSKKELIRIMSENVDRNNLNPHILEYSNYLAGEFTKQIAEEVSKYRIVVTTLILIGRYSQKYHPDVVFIDEAAQPLEPEACCALAMIEKGKQIVLAGDPRQLGPSIQSTVATGYGLGKSLLERMMDLPLYQTHNTNFITMLKLNFRSHSTILALPNELFYSNQLRAVSIKAQNDPLARMFVFNKIQGLYNKKTRNYQNGQAMEFCSIISQECRQGQSPSYFNKKEYEMVLKYVQALTRLQFDNEEDRVLPEQIGVVTPYIRQVYKILNVLQSSGFEKVEVGTTETFQGREKRVIIISTVRAKSNLLAFDKKYNLGFVRNEKRFNVALTRAMSKLIVIGCAHVLGTDNKWERYITFCEDIHAFCGAPYARRTQDVRNDILRRFHGIQLRDQQFNH